MTNLSKTDLNGLDLYDAFLSGATAIISHRKELNSINVFPIADGDTGNNLAHTMLAIQEQAQAHQHFKTSLLSLADASLMGARGNSGIIFSQFINGLADQAPDQEQLNPKDFALLVKKASTYARDALSKPVEGTIITVIEQWSSALFEFANENLDFAPLLKHGLSVARQALKETTQKNKILQKANVLDAGALGFLYFLEAFTQSSITGESELQMETSSPQAKKEDSAPDHEAFDPRFRYCVEAIVQDLTISKETLKERLKKLGNSLIIAGTEKKTRLHIHTSQPEKLFFQLKDWGHILFQKADDMQRQFESIYERRHPIAIVTDSIADIPQDFIDAHQIHLLPLNLIIDGVNYLDKITMTPQYFYQLMDELENYPSSSQPTIKEAEKVLRDLADHYQSIIVITVSSQMSGTYETLVKASQTTDLKEHQIAILDSKLNSGAQGLIVKKAADLLEKGYSFEEIIPKLEETVAKTSIYVSVQTLEYMIKSGRIGKAQAFAANLINLKPVVSINEQGQGIVIGKALSLKANTKKIQDLVKAKLENHQIESYAIVHANGGKRVVEFESYYTNLLGMSPDYVMEISPIVAMSAGLGSIAIALTLA